MRLIETIPIHSTATWVAIIGVIFFVFTLIFAFVYALTDKKSMLIIFIASMVIVLIMLGLTVTHAADTFNHEEYVVELTDITARDFFKEYEITKTFEYSNVVQIRAIR